MCMHFSFGFEYLFRSHSHRLFCIVICLFLSRWICVYNSWRAGASVCACSRTQHDRIVCVCMLSHCYHPMGLCVALSGGQTTECGECFRKHNDLKLFSVSGANELVVRIILASNHFNIQNNPRLEQRATVKYVFVFRSRSAVHFSFRLFANVIFIFFLSFWNLPFILLFVQCGLQSNICIRFRKTPHDEDAQDASNKGGKNKRKHRKIQLIWIEMWQGMSVCLRVYFSLGGGDNEQHTHTHLCYSCSQLHYSEYNSVGQQKISDKENEKKRKKFSPQRCNDE